jgi:heme O synthase-like polyprenyltransferase
MNDITGVVNNSEVVSIQGKILTGIVNPIIVILSALAFAWFMYGVTRFVIMKDNEEERSNGKKHIIFGILALVIIFSIWGILNVLGGAVESKIWFVS